VLRILHENSKKRKLCAQFVPLSLTCEQCEQRVASCKDLLEMVRRNKNFLSKIIMGDETCSAYDEVQNELEKIRQGKKLRFQKSHIKTMFIIIIFFFPTRSCA